MLYAVLDAGGSPALCISRDWGKTWRRSTALPSDAVKIYIDPQSPPADRTVYVVCEEGLAVRKGGRWSNLPRPPWAGALHDVSAGFPGPVIYAATPDTVWLSPDGGTSWRAAWKLARQSGEVARDPRKRADGIFAVTACLRQPATAYLSYAGLREGGEVFWGVAKTTDTGGTWTLPWKESRTTPAPVRDSWLNTRFPFWSREPMELQVAAADPNVCYGVGRGRTVRTADGGKSWNALYLPPTGGRGLHHHGPGRHHLLRACTWIPFNARRVFITYTDVGLFRSEDGGVSWNSATAGVPRDWVNTTYWVEFDPAVKGRMWGVMSGVHDLPRVKMWRGSPAAGAGKVKWTSRYNGGVCRSEDGGRSWTVSSEGMPATAPTHILLDPGSPPEARVLYVAAFGRGVFKSVDGGRTWSLKNTGIRGSEPFAWRLARDREGTLYLVVARRSEDGRYGNDDDGALYRSRDGAETWERLTLPAGVNGPNGLAIDAADPRRLYLAAWGRSGREGAAGGGIFLSEDAGASWRNLLDRDQHVYDVTAASGALYACGFESTAWRSTDHGLTWSRIRGFNFKWGHRVIPDPSHPRMIYITTFGGSRVVRSRPPATRLRPRTC